MRIVYLAAGAAGMYCGSCLHDNTLAAALLKAGQDVLMVPTYTPIRTDEEDVSYPRVFLGGINVALQQKWSWFQHTPQWFDRIWDRPSLLSWLARRAGSTDPAQLGELTVSMLRGDEGRQKKEVTKLIDWLDEEVKPSLIHLSNSMLTGLSRQLKRRLGVPVICSLSGEDMFLEKLTPPHYEQARHHLRQQCREVDAFVALNDYYAQFMSEYLSVPRDRVHVIPHGLNLDGHTNRWEKESPSSVPTIGFLARICSDKGLHVLADAFIKMCKRREKPNVRLLVAGYLGRQDRRYLAQVEQQLEAENLKGRYQYVGEPTRAEKIEFLQSLDVLCVPTVYPESKGLPILEALANAVPVVVPDHGCFPELVQDTQGGFLFRPSDSSALAEVLDQVLSTPGLAQEYGTRGHQAIRERYHAARMADQTQSLYQSILKRNSR